MYDRRVHVGWPCLYDYQRVFVAPRHDNVHFALQNLAQPLPKGHKEPSLRVAVVAKDDRNPARGRVQHFVMTELSREIRVCSWCWCVGAWVGERAWTAYAPSSVRTRLPVRYAPARWVCVCVCVCACASVSTRAHVTPSPNRLSSHSPNQHHAIGPHSPARTPLKTLPPAPAHKATLCTLLSSLASATPSGSASLTWGNPVNFLTLCTRSLMLMGSDRVRTRPAPAPTRGTDESSLTSHSTLLCFG